MLAFKNMIIKKCPQFKIEIRDFCDRNPQALNQCTFAEMNIDYLERIISDSTPPTPQNNIYEF